MRSGTLTPIATRDYGPTAYSKKLTAICPRFPLGPADIAANPKNRQAANCSILIAACDTEFLTPYKNTMDGSVWGVVKSDPSITSGRAGVVGSGDGDTAQGDVNAARQKLSKFTPNQLRRRHGQIERAVSILHQTKYGAARKMAASAWRNRRPTPMCSLGGLAF